MPLKTISPDVGLIILRMVLMVVVFPAPLGPINPKIFPGFTVKDKLSTARVELNLFIKLFTMSIFCLKIILENY